MKDKILYSLIGLLLIFVIFTNIKLSNHIEETKCIEVDFNLTNFDNYERIQDLLIESDQMEYIENKQVKICIYEMGD